MPTPTRLILCLAALLSATLNTDAQKPSVPAGYQLQKGDAQVLRADLDGDSKPDVFYAIEKGGEDGRLMALMSSTGKTVMSGSVSTCCGSIAGRGKTVKVASRGMRGFSYWTFRWEAAARDFRLIGYDIESFGNATNDGSGKASLNLLTGDFEAAFNSWNAKSKKLIALPKVRKKVTVDRRIYVQTFDDANDAWVSELMHRNYPKQVQ